MKYTSHYDSPIGGMTLCSDGEKLTGLCFDNQKYFSEILDKEPKSQKLPVFEETRRWLDIYFEGSVPDFTPPLLMNCSDFRKAVWNIMLKIPYGHTMTYGEIASEIAAERGIKKMSAQAVGGAVGHNSFAIIIPCHRVVGTNGSLTGYGGGMDKKVKLLSLEKVNMDNFFIPKYSKAV